MGKMDMSSNDKLSRRRREKGKMGIWEIRGVEGGIGGDKFEINALSG